MELKFSIRTECMLIMVIAGLLALISCLTLGCGNDSGAGFAGTYVNAAGSEFSVANDTLIVEPVEAHTYLLHRRTGFRLLDEQGNAGKLQQESEEWTAVYDPETGILTEQRYGKSIRFNENKSEMTVGRRVYERIH